MILVVDDDPDTLEQAQEILNKTRRVFLASNANRAFALAQRLGFSVALVDLNLHGKDGLELIRRLHENLPNLPIIAICGQIQRQLLKMLTGLGVVEILNRPVSAQWKPVVERIREKRRALGDDLK